MELLTKSAKETKDLGQKTATGLRISDKAAVFALSGDLGSGKTTFTQGFAKGLGIDQRIVSPTFVLMRKYEISNSKSGFRHFYHMDLYRLEGDVTIELVNLGFNEVISKPDNLVVIEWAEKARDIMPNWTKWITFKVKDEATREVSII